LKSQKKQEKKKGKCSICTKQSGIKGETRTRRKTETNTNHKGSKTRSKLWKKGQQQEKTVDTIEIKH
jgi:hypothetical protein